MSKIVAQSEKFRLIESILFQSVFFLAQNLILVAQESSPKSPNSEGLSMRNQASPPKSPNTGGLSIQLFSSKFALSLLKVWGVRRTKTSFKSAKPNFYAFAGMNFRETPFMQYRFPVGAGPSLKTWPRCPPHRRQWTSVRDIKKLRSTVVAIALSRGS